LLNLPGKENIAQKIKEAMQDIEKYKPELDGADRWGQSRLKQKQTYNHDFRIYK